MARVNAGPQDGPEGLLPADSAVAGFAEPLDIEEMLSRTLERVLQATEMDVAVVHLLGQDTDTGIVARRGAPAERVPVEEQAGLARCPVGQAAMSGEALTNGDGSPQHCVAPELVGGMGNDALICTPIAPRGEALGVVCLFGRRPRAFSRHEKGLLVVVADAVAIAVEKARLLGRLRRANEQISELSLSAIGSEFSISFANQNLVKCWVENVCGNVTCPAHRSRDLRCWQIAGTTCALRAQGKFSRLLASCRECRVFQKSCLHDDITSIRESFNNMVFALRSEARHRTETTRQLMERLISAQEDERKRVARELHDQTSQSLAVLLVGLKNLESAATADEVQQRASEMEALTLQALDDVRRLALDLRPAALDELGLTAALRDYLKETSGRCGLTIGFQATGMESRLPAGMETALYRIVQEGVTNVIRHAQAENVMVSLERQGQWVIVRIRDDGKGFGMEYLRQRAASTQGLGLIGMRERATLLGGKFTVESEPGKGTTVTVELPLELEAADMVSSNRLGLGADAAGD